ncbi:MAG: hypothetical protein RQ714_09040 [Nitrosomonas sp.]|nr:hypothetical protein [Nitrosomonas sp.]
MLKTEGTIQFSYQLIKQWPPLTWVALCSEVDKTISVRHGNQVETHDEWFCEAVWPDNFEEGNFDLTDLVAGTGGRYRNNAIIFVSSGNTVDRILSLQTDKGLLVSNSLACLLAVSNAKIDITYPDYYQDFATIIHGLTGYKRTLATSLGSVDISEIDI